MPGPNVRQASKNMSRSKRAAIAKNSNRVEAAIRGSLEGCSYGRITKALGNKTFILLDGSKREHQAHIRGKMARIGIDDVVLLSERDYETRSGTEKAVYDIMAVLSKHETAYLIKQGQIPKWMLNSLNITGQEKEEEELFEYEENDEEDGDEIEAVGKKSIVIRRHEINLEEDDIDIDKI